MLAWQHARHKVDIATLGGALTRSHTGWIITSGGSQLILPAGSSQQVGNNSPLILKKRGKSPHSSAAANRVIDILPIAEVEEERKRGENLPILAVLAEYGIAPTPYVLELIRLPHITPNYIRFHDRRLQKENRYPPACSSLSILPPTSPLLDFGSLPSSSPSSTFTQLVLNKQDIKSPTKLSRKIKMVLRSSPAFSFSSPVSRGPSG